MRSMASIDEGAFFRHFSLITTGFIPVES